jgi:hypothetical protein
MQAIADKAMINTTMIKGCVSPLQALTDLDRSQEVSMSEPRLYEQDICLWAEKTAKLLRAHRWKELDLENLIDEVEDLSRRERDKLLGTLRVLLMHLLK